MLSFDAKLFFTKVSMKLFLSNELIIHAGIVLKQRNDLKRYVVIHETRIFISVTKEILLKIIDPTKSNI